MIAKPTDGYGLGLGSGPGAGWDIRGHHGQGDAYGFGAGDGPGCNDPENAIGHGQGCTCGAGTVDGDGLGVKPQAGHLWALLNHFREETP